MKYNFKHNDCGVVINPIIFFQYKPKDALAWLYWEITVGKCINGLWNFGLWYGGGCYSCSVGIYKTQQEAEKEGILRLKSLFDKPFNNKYLYSEKIHLEAKKVILSFANKTFLSKELQTGHLIHIIDNGNNYIQGSLF